MQDLAIIAGRYREFVNKVCRNKHRLLLDGYYAVHVIWLNDDPPFGVVVQGTKNGRTVRSIIRGD